VTQPGRGGQQPAPINSAAGQATVVGTQPGVSGGIVRARQVIISGAGDGVFVYDGSGNLIGSWVGPSGDMTVGPVTGPQVVILPGSSGTASEVAFPVPSPPALAAAANLAASGGPPALFLVSGPQLAAAGFTDWVQIEMASDDGVSTEATCYFNYVTTLGVPEVIGSFNGNGWQLGTTAVSGTLTINGTDIVLALSGQPTTTDGLTDGTINGSSSTTGLPNGGTQGTSGAASAGTAHTHGPGSYSVTNGMHSHTAGSYAVTNGQHAHDLPVI
jgi:hypothetical protein